MSRERVFELLADRALEGLDPAEQAELARLGAAADASFERAAAALDLAASPPSGEPLPQRLAQSIEGHAAAFFAQRRAAAPAIAPQMDRARTELMRQPPVAITRPPASVTPIARRRSWGPWLLAAAFLGLAVGGWALVLRRPAPLTAARGGLPAIPASPPPPLAPAAAREAMIAAGARVTPWAATKDAAAKGATGDVVWDPETQRGFMRFRGVEKNDPRLAQYQLWIFDGERDERYPVDGGVFDVSGDEVIVPIRAKLPVASATLFAVTVERPGGVVVSSRERIVVTASTKG